MNSFDNLRYDQIKVGDILLGKSEGSLWRNPYEITQILNHRPERIRVEIKSHDGVKIPYSLYRSETYIVAIRMMQYDPTQQGDTEEDI